MKLNYELEEQLQNESESGERIVKALCIANKDKMTDPPLEFGKVYTAIYGWTNKKDEYDSTNTWITVFNEKDKRETFTNNFFEILEIIQ